jgi:hypothetical protein
MLENLGKDLCRTILIYQNIKHQDIRQSCLQELVQKQIMDQDETSGSDSAPSEDNLMPDELK